MQTHARSLIGRDEELARLQRALAAARAGNGRIVLLSGEAGIGKTHLARAFLDSEVAAGTRVGIGRAWDGAGAPAFYAWTCAFNALGHPLGLNDGLARNADAFASVERVVQHAQAMSRDQPVALMLDDLQWADVPALLALRLLARSALARLLVIGTVRVPERVDAPIEELLVEIMREVDVIPLRGLGVAELGALAESSGMPREVIEGVHRASAGNPFFACELLLDADARTALTGEGDLPVPAGARALLARRFAALGDGLEIISCAALGPQPHLAPTLVARALGCPREQVVVAFEAASQSGVLARTGKDAFAFAHDLMRAAALDQLQPARRVELHAAWAKALEGSVEPNLIIRGALHAIAADPGCSPESVRNRAFEAGSVALEQMSFDDARSLFEYAASSDELAGRLGGAARSVAALAETVTRAGDPTRGQEIARRALCLAREGKDPDAFARAALALGRKNRLGVTDATLIATLEEALRGIATHDVQDVSLTCALEARLASALQPFIDPPRALTLARTAVARARETSDERLLARTLDAARPAFRPLDGLEERREMDTELLYLATKHHDTGLAAQACARLCVISIERGDAQALDVHLQAYAELAKLAASAQHELGVLSLKALRAVIRGNVAVALELIDAVEAARPRWSISSAVLANVDPVVGLRAALAVITDDHEGYRALGAAPNPPLTASMFTLIGHVRCGDRARAETLYEQVADRVLSPQAENYVYRVILANAMIALGDRGRASAMYAWLAQFHGRHVVWTPFLFYDGSVDRLRGGLAALLGDEAGARSHFENALASETAFGAEPFAQRTRAERDAGVGRVDDRLASTIDERVRAATARWGLTERTAEVLAHVVQGHANATIAKLLGISTRAVEMHVTKLLDSAGLDSRAALIARVLGA